MGIANPEHKLVTCPLCGFNTPAEQKSTACRQCIFGQGCTLSRCERCGYEWAQHSRIVDWLRRLLGKRGQQQ